MTHSDNADDLGPLDQLIPLIFQELRAMAHRQLGREPAGVTLQTTDVVHEAYLRLSRDAAVTSRGRPYFFAAVARTIRQVLIDAARRRQAVKRDGGRMAMDSEPLTDTSDAYGIELLQLDQALQRLAETHPRPARTVECRFFGGMSVEETAEALGVSPRTVKSDWALARAWLFDALHENAA